MPSYNDTPPAFNDPSAADEIYKLIKDAIEVKSLLANAVSAVRKVDSVAGTKFSKSLDAVDKVNAFLPVPTLTTMLVISLSH